MFERQINMGVGKYALYYHALDPFSLNFLDHFDHVFPFVL
jgi:hypothetical protein